jgi:hypothetical protein
MMQSPTLLFDKALRGPPKDPLLLFSALGALLTTYIVAFDGDVARQRAAQYLAFAEKLGGKVPLMAGHGFLGAFLLLTGNIAEDLAGSPDVTTISPDGTNTKFWDVPRLNMNSCSRSVERLNAGHNLYSSFGCAFRSRAQPSRRQQGLYIESDPNVASYTWDRDQENADSFCSGSHFSDLAGSNATNDRGHGHRHNGCRRDLFIHVCDDEGIGIRASSDELASVLTHKRIGLHIQGIWPAVGFVQFYNFWLQKSPSQVFGQNSGNSLAAAA